MYRDEWINGKPHSDEGAHKLYVGPTRSGKTTLCRLFARLRNYVVVLGTKPIDKNLDAYVREGYVRIDHWPPTRSDLKDQPHDQARVILWPKMRKREDLRRFRSTYLRCFDDVYMRGGWTVVADEGYWIAKRSGLALDQALEDLAFGGASAGVSLHLCLQRPSGVPRITWQSVSDAFIFHGGITDDVRELASLGTYQPRDVVRVVTTMGRNPDGSPTGGHPFLHLPCTARRTWGLSEAKL